MLGFFFLFFFFRLATAALRAAEILAKFLPYGAVQWKRAAAGWLVRGAGGAARAFATAVV